MMILFSIIWSPRGATVEVRLPVPQGKDWLRNYFEIDDKFN